MFIGDIGKGTELRIVKEIDGTEVLSYETVAIGAYKTNATLIVKGITDNNRIIRIDMPTPEEENVTFYLDLVGTRNCRFILDNIKIVQHNGKLYHMLESTFRIEERNKRNAVRIDLKADGVIEYGLNKKVKCRTLDISMTGLGVVVYEQVPEITLGSKVNIKFYAGKACVEHDGQCRVVRKNEIDSDRVEIGLRFVATPNDVKNLIMAMQMEDLKKKRSRL